MSDHNLNQGQGVPKDMVTKYRDMGDGTHAKVVAVAGEVTGPLTDAEMRDTPVPVSGNVVATGYTGMLDEDGAEWGVRNVNNKIYALCKPYGHDVAEGNLPSITPVRRFGHNHDVGTAEETVSHIGAVMYYPDAAEILKIKSDDADDDGAPVGDGARTVWIQGLDDNYEIITDTITMNGTTAVNSNVAFLRVFKMQVVTYGASGLNEGEITAYGVDGTSKIISIHDAENESHSASFTVPADQVVYITELVITSAGSKGADLRLYMRSIGGAFFLKRAFSIFNTGLVIAIDMPLKIVAETDIEIRAEGIIAGAIVSAGFAGWREAA